MKTKTPKTITDWIVTTTTKRHGYKWQTLHHSEAMARTDYETKKCNRAYATVEIDKRIREVQS